MTDGRGPYTGQTKKLLVSVDIGTTFTAVSFSLLMPGDIPIFTDIQRWPKQAMTSAKVPSVIFYDSQGQPKAYGAETEDEDVVDQADTHGWRKAEWWKLHMRPAHLPIIEDLVLHPLPSTITPDQVLTDYLTYVRQQLQQYVTNQFGDGAKIWKSLFPTMEVVLTAPNGWEIGQLQRMRLAAQKAGLATGSEGGKRIRFVSEAEAAALYAFESGCIGEWVKNEAELILCDCGGGTIDIASYKITNTTPLKLEETTAASCYCAGAIYVTKACRRHLEDLLKGNEYGTKEAIDRMVAHFEKMGKYKFDNIDSSSTWIEVPGVKNYPNLGIARGKLKLSGTTVAGFFERSLNQVKEGLEKAYRASNFRAKKVILVGGLASSPYIYNELKAWGARNNVAVSRPDGPTTKAVANGALAWYLDNTVSARINKYHYGTCVDLPLLPWLLHDDPEALARGPSLGPDGILYASGFFSSIVEKDIRIEKGHEYTEKYIFQVSADTTDFERSCNIWVYRWEQPSRFVTYPDDDTKSYPGFELLCSVEANVRQPFLASPMQYGIGGRGYKDVKFDICLSFGETELTARMRWLERGAFKYGKATIAHRSMAPEAE